MAVSPILEINEIGPTMADKTTPMNDMIVAIEGATNDQLPVDMSGGDVTLSFLQFARNQIFNCASLAATQHLTIPQVTPTGGLPAKRMFAVRNLSSTHSVVVGGTIGATVTIAASSGAVIQSDGSNCYVYGTGGPGPAGPAGGAITIGYAFSTTTTNADPGAGFLRLNNATQNAATAIYAEVLAFDSTDWTSVLDTLDAATGTNKGTIRLYNQADPTKWLVFTLTARTAHTGYRELTVTPVSGSSASPFANTDHISLAFDRTGDTGGVASVSGAGAITASTTAGTVTVNMGTIATGHVIANATGTTAVPGDTALSDLLDTNFGTIQGEVIFRSAVGWTGLVPGTAGDVLQTNGTAANPSWVPQSGGSGLTPIPPGDLIANTGTGTAIPTGVSLTALLDANFGTVQGEIIFRSGTAWAALAPGTAGNVLQTNGTVADPTWVAPSGGGLSPIPPGDLIANTGTGTATPIATTLTALIDKAIGNVQGDVLYRSSSGWSALAPGTSGQALLTGGTLANPSWGSVTGTIAPVAPGSLIANTGTGTATPVGTTLTALLDNVMGNAQGDILIRNGSVWAALPPGSSGQILQSGGTAANPTWATASLTLPVSGSQIISGGTNTISAAGTLDAFIGGGSGNTIASTGTMAIVVGGSLNSSSSPFSFIGGGKSNVLSTSFQYEFIGGGTGNSIASSDYGAIVGGLNNSITGGSAGAIAGGQGNTVSTFAGFAAGANNNANTASAPIALGDTANSGGHASLACGYQAVASGDVSAVFGQATGDRGNVASFVYPAVSNFAQRLQSENHVLWNVTSGATAVRLTGDGATAGAHNVITTKSKSAKIFYIDVVIIDNSNGNGITYTFGPAVLTEGSAGVSTTAVVGGSWTAGSNLGSGLTLAAAPSVVGDTTNGGINLSYTPPTGNSHTLYAVANVRGTMIWYG